MTQVGLPRLPATYDIHRGLCIETRSIFTQETGRRERQLNCMQLVVLPMSLIGTEKVGVGGDDGHV